MPTTIRDLIPLPLSALLATRPDIEVIEMFVSDLNGIGRGKWLPADKARTLESAGALMPRSVFALDIFGRDVAEAGLAFGTGDPDGACRPVGPASIMPWMTRPSAQVMVQMSGADGAPFFADPREVLRRQVARLDALGYRPVVAAELEFYLVEPNARRAAPPATEASDAVQVLSVDALQAIEPLLAQIADACTAQGVPADAVSRENGPGQYEINLHHVDDALAAADHAVLLKRIVKGVARRHGLAATFMAKPYGRCSGSGLHIHVSLLDRDGAPAFAQADGAPSAILRHAVGGLLETMQDAMPLFAPHANSYRRLQPNSHAPNHASWGLDNRAAAVRVIQGTPGATRLEHRVPGADANPYLALAAVLAGIAIGVERRSDPGSPAIGDGTDAPPLPLDWRAAVERFAQSRFIGEALGRDYQQLFTACKRQDLRSFAEQVPDCELEACLTTV